MKDKAIVRGHTLVDQVTEALSEEIRSESLSTGDKLAPESRLAEQYGVSRSVVREAISRLKSEGMLTSHQGLGVFVADGQGVGAVFRMKAMGIEDRTDIAHTFELLSSVEVSATGMAAERRTAAQLKSIERQLKSIERAIRKGTAGVEEDLGFHREITAATHNPIYIDFSSFLEKRSRRMILVARHNTARTPGLALQVQEEHEAIFRAIEARDATVAREAAQTHLTNAAERLSIYDSPAR